ncbi:MAG: glycosyltransferase [Anaerolineae bacterium]|nr:glycosyltransferase [Anaerolineae bacterium]
MRVAIVHDWLNQVGGAEHVLEALKGLFPDAPIYTSIYDPDRMPANYQAWDIRTSFMQRLPGVSQHHQWFLMLYPFAFEAFDLSGYDLVISNKSAFCHGVVTPPETLHISYCLTPTRFVWMYEAYRQREHIGQLSNAVLRVVIPWLRLWDRAAADRVDRFVAISRAIQQRIRKYYRRESEIIYPPVDTDRFRPLGQPPGEYFLVVSRLIPYKRIDIAVDAFTRLGLPLWIVGDGRDRAALEKRAGDNVRFLGRVSDAELVSLLQGCRAFIFPGLEDFGIAPLEAMACGRPVIAYAGGGALDTVVEGKTGLFFREQTPEALAEVVQRFAPTDFNPAECRAQAERFSQAAFRERLRTFVESQLAQHRSM